MTLSTISRILLPISLLLAGISQAGDGDDFPGVRALMTPEEYRDTGLDKLSDEELEALDAWLIRYTVGESEVIRNTSEEVRQVEEAFEISATIKPPFTGWKGDTVFYLDNGQVWQQRVEGRYQYSGDDNRVVLKKNFLGMHVMELVATGKAVGVKRIR